MRLSRPAGRSSTAWWPELSKARGISEQTLYVWRKRFGAMQADEVRRLRKLEQENARRKKPVVEQRGDEGDRRKNDERTRASSAGGLRTRAWAVVTAGVCAAARGPLHAEAACPGWLPGMPRWWTRCAPWRGSTRAMAIAGSGCSLRATIIGSGMARKLPTTRSSPVRWRATFSSPIRSLFGLATRRQRECQRPGPPILATQHGLEHHHRRRSALGRTTPVQPSQKETRFQNVPRDLQRGINQHRFGTGLNSPCQRQIWMPSGES